MTSASRGLKRFQKHRLLKSVFDDSPRAHNEGLTARDGHANAWRLRVPGPQWSYAASWKKIASIPRQGPIIVEIDLEVEEAAVGIGFVTNDQSYVGKEAIVPPTGLTTVTITAEQTGSIEKLVLRNADPGNTTTWVRILEIRVFSARLLPPFLYVLYQPGKTGSQTVEASIRNSDEEGLVERHHFLAPRTFSAFESFLQRSQETGAELDSIRTQLRLAKNAADLLRHYDPASTFVITGVRDPFDRAISAFFHHLDIFCPDLSLKAECASFESAEVASRFSMEFELFLARRESRSVAPNLRLFLLDQTMQNLDDWMRDELLRVFRIDASRIQFGSEPFVTFSHQKRTFLIYRLESLTTSLSRMLRLLPLSGTPSPENRNLASDKPYAVLYNATRSRLTPTRKMMRYYYEDSELFSRSFRHYTPAIAQ